VSHPKRYVAARKVRGSVLARVAAGFAAVADRLRHRRSVTEVEFTEERHLWGGDEDGGLASAGVLRRPPDQSGSGSAALAESFDSSDIERH